LAQEELLVLPQLPQLVAEEREEREEIPYLVLSFVSAVEAAI
jgi:hypothetical protein